MLLLDEQTVDTTGTQETISCNGGTLLMQVDGTFGGGTLTIQGSMEGFDFQDLRDEAGDVYSITEETTFVVNSCKAGLTIRASLTGATGASLSVGVLQ